MQSFGKHPVGTFKVIHRSNSGRVPIARTMLRTAACNNEDFNAAGDNGWASNMATVIQAMRQLRHPDAEADACLPAEVAINSSSKYDCNGRLNRKARW